MYVYIYTYTYIQFFDRQETMYCMLCFLSTLQAPCSPQTEPVFGVDLCSFTDDCYMVAKVHLLRLPTRARKPLGVYPIGLRSSSCSATKGTPPPWTTYVPIEVNTRQVDGLARILFLFVFVVIPPHSQPSNYSRDAHRWCAVNAPIDLQFGDSIYPAGKKLSIFWVLPPHS